jgi:hypothetical protein
MFAAGLVMRILRNYVESGRTEPVLPQCELQLGGSETDFHFTKNREGASRLLKELLAMKGLDVFRWLMPVALAALLSVPVQSANAHGMGGGGGHMGGMGGGHMGGMGGRGHPSMGARFISHNGTSRFAQHQGTAFRGDRFRDDRFGREGRFEGRERFENKEREEHEFFFRHNFFGAFDFGAFGFWPWWWWGWPGWWDGWYPDYDDYYPYYDDSSANGPRYGADYWNKLAVSVQTKLANQGYYHGQVDGIIGSGSIEAIRRFQADHGLKATGKIDPKLLKALGVSYKA